MAGYYWQITFEVGNEKGCVGHWRFDSEQSAKDATPPNRKNIRIFEEGKFPEDIAKQITCRHCRDSIFGPGK